MFPVIGPESGANGVAAWGSYHYHYNDLGTVMATTDAVGDLLGVYEPDHFGNYRFVHSVITTGNKRPDTMGLTGKYFDTEPVPIFGARGQVRIVRGFRV